MTKQWKFAFLALIVAGATWLAPAVKADEWDKKTVLTFNEPVEVPGRVLTPGQYVFKLLDSQTDRNVIEIYTGDEKHLVTTIMAIPNYRLEPPDKTVITFEERPSGTPEAIHAWFYPGDNYGWEFVYPKSEKQYARSEQLVTPPATPAAPVAQPVVAQSDSDRATPVVEEVKEEVIVAQAVASAPADNPSPTVDTAPAAMPDALPQTAGNSASIVLFGIVLLSGGLFVLRFAAARS